MIFIISILLQLSIVKWTGGQVQWHGNVHLLQQCLEVLRVAKEKLKARLCVDDHLPRSRFPVPEHQFLLVLLGHRVEIGERLRYTGVDSAYQVAIYDDNCCITSGRESARGDFLQNGIGGRKVQVLEW